MDNASPFRRRSVGCTTNISQPTFVTPGGANQPPNYNELLNAPKKHKIQHNNKRRSSAPASLLDCQDIRKRLYFDAAGAETYTVNSILKGKRKLRREEEFHRPCKELIASFTELQITPRSTKRVKFVATDDHLSLSSSPRTVLDFSDSPFTPKASKVIRRREEEGKELDTPTAIPCSAEKRKIFTDEEGFATPARLYTSRSMLQ